MNWKTIFTVYRKELRDQLRDRRTVISMIVIPTVLMPGLMFGAVAVAMKVVSKAKATIPSVVVVGGEDSPKVRTALAANSRISVEATPSDWKQQIGDKKIRAAVEIPAGFDIAVERGEPVAVRLHHYEGEVRSGFAVGELRRFFTDYREQVVRSRLEANGLPATLVKPFDIESRNVAPPEKVGGNLFGGMVPYFFLLLCFTGAMYPALDLTAGEKERGTMETILCSPVPRMDLVLGKFLMVLTASLGTVMFALLSSVVTLLIAGNMLASKMPGGAKAAAASTAQLPSIDPVGLVGVVIMVLPMAILFAAVQFTLALFAKSFKEAQSYVSPLIVIIIIPAVLGMLPGVELNAKLAFVPILNVSLVSKELVSGVWHWDLIALIFGSTCLYAAIALFLAVRMFNRESVIFRA